MMHEPIPAEDEKIAHQVIGAAIEVHRVLGPGFLEVVYERAMLHEMQLRGLKVEKQKDLLVPYKDIQIEGQRLDVLVGGRVIVELKAVSELHPLHQAQLLSYLKATGLRLGLLINFNVPVLKDGLKRMVR
jgi:GxxExxY protein